MTISECQVETQKHIERVRFYIRKFTDALTTRGVNHDHCKLEEPEVSVFAEHTPALATVGYQTPEYQEHMAAMKSQSRHHPEHFDDGILGMNLIDLCEMFCDWKAATERHNDGNLLKSIQINAQRFGYDDQLKRIFLNTAKLFDENQ